MIKSDFEETPDYTITWRVVFLADIICGLLLFIAVKFSELIDKFPVYSIVGSLILFFGIQFLIKKIFNK